MGGTVHRGVPTVKKISQKERVKSRRFKSRNFDIR